MSFNRLWLTPYTDDQDETDKYWVEMARPVGNKPSNEIKDPEHLWKLACEYFAFLDANPLEKKDFIKSGQMAGMEVVIKYKRPYSWESLVQFLRQRKIRFLLSDFVDEDGSRYEEFKKVVEVINCIILSQRFEQVAVGNYAPIALTKQFNASDKSTLDKIKEQPFFKDAGIKPE